MIGSGQRKQSAEPARARARNTESLEKGSERVGGDVIRVDRLMLRDGCNCYGVKGGGEGGEGIQGGVRGDERGLNSNGNSFTDKRPAWNNDVYILTACALSIVALTCTELFIGFSRLSRSRLDRSEHAPMAPVWQMKENSNAPRLCYTSRDSAFQDARFDWETHRGCLALSLASRVSFHCSFRFVFVLDYTSPRFFDTRISMEISN